jgi:hypothetical protein
MVDCKLRKQEFQEIQEGRQLRMKKVGMPNHRVCWSWYCSGTFSSYDTTRDVGRSSNAGALGRQVAEGYRTRSSSSLIGGAEGKSIDWCNGGIAELSSKGGADGSGSGSVFSRLSYAKVYSNRSAAASLSLEGGGGNSDTEGGLSNCVEVGEEFPNSKSSGAETCVSDILATVSVSFGGALAKSASRASRVLSSVAT